MRDMVVKITYSTFYLVFALVLLYLLPVLAHLFGGLATAVLVPLLESVVQNMSNI